MALNGDGEINDLLALMGGEQAAATVPLSSKSPAKEESIKVKSKKRKKKKSHKGKHDAQNNINDESIVSFADTRLSQNCFGWPSSTNNNGQRVLYLGSGLLHNCKGYICNEQHTHHYGESKCQTCGKSAATHELCISSSWSGEVDEKTKACHPQSIISVASMTIASRNARCLIGEYHPSANSEKQKKAKELIPQLNSTRSSSVMISNALDVYLGRILVVVKRMQNELPKPDKNRDETNEKQYKLGCIASISASDVQLLQEKTSSLILSVQDYKNTISQGDSSSINIIEKRLSAMSACDVVYYRCYYAAVVSSCSTDNDVDGSIMASIIPHPPTYFTCPGLAWDVSAGVESLRIFLGEVNDNKLEYLAAPLDLSTKQTLLKSWGLEERLSAAGRTSGTKNPLSTLWQSRYLETIRHVWCTRYSFVQSPIALQQVAESASDDSNRTQYFLNDSEDILKVHDTAHISPGVAQWRSDSVRDYPANFYAYATPTSPALQVITKYIESANIEQILEAGAGTGYWSTLLNAELNGIKKEPVVAYDLTPPSSNNGKVVESNEYHGDIPTFMRVHQADTLSQALSSSAITSGTSTVLMLCYPPPASDMAFNALSAHISKDGRIVIHIGEWQGLTGSDEFEALLKQEFNCQETVPLPSWGTDSTYLTIWSKKLSGDEQDGDASDKIFSPAMGFCSVEQCSSPATKRCRYARSLQYCSIDCYQKHSAERKSFLSLQMVHTISGDELKYQNDGHFMDLKQLSMKRESNNQLSDMPRKRRKKKRRR